MRLIAIERYLIVFEIYSHVVPFEFIVSADHFCFVLYSGRSLPSALADFPSLKILENLNGRTGKRYHCSVTSLDLTIRSDTCEIFYDIGCVGKDTYFPARDAFKFGCTPTEITRRAKPVECDSILLRQMTPLYVGMTFTNQQNGELTSRYALLDVWVLDSDLSAAQQDTIAYTPSLNSPTLHPKGSHATFTLVTPMKLPATNPNNNCEQQQSATSASSNSNQQSNCDALAIIKPVSCFTVSPVKHLHSAGRCFLLGDTGGKKLQLVHNAVNDNLAMLDDQPLPI